MTTTINISLPKEMYKDAKKAAKQKRYTSISELVRDALRKTIYNENEITENGFPRWFEDRVLESERQPVEEDGVWETEENVHRYFKDLHKRLEKRRNGKS